MSLTKEDLQAISELMDDKLEAVKADLKQDIQTVNQRVAVVESKVLHELSVISEGITGWNERNRQIDLLEDKTDDHEHRIFALEQVAKK